MKEAQINFEIYTNETYDKIIDELLTIPKEWSPEQISALVSKKFSLTLITGQPLEKNVVGSFPFYRIRVCNESDGIIDESNPQSFSYPPKKEFVKNLGRANIVGMQVLYGSGDPNTPFHELSESITLGKSIVYLTKWGIKPEAVEPIMRNLFYGIPFEDSESYAGIMAKTITEGIEKQLSSWPAEVRQQFLYGQKKYNELFCAEGEDYYHITSAMVYNHFNSKPDTKVEVPIIAYPSVAKKKDTVNFVIKKEFVDKYMYIQEVKKMVVQELNDDVVQTTLLSKGLLVDGKIKWQKIRTTLNNIEYDKAKVIFNGMKGTIQDLKSEDRITTCCAAHGMTLEQFFLKSKKTPESIMQAFNNTDIGSYEGKFPLTVQRAIVAPTSGTVYLNDKIASDKMISHFVVPFTYTLSFEYA